MQLETRLFLFEINKTDHALAKSVPRPLRLLRLIRINISSVESSAMQAKNRWAFPSLTSDNYIGFLFELVTFFQSNNTCNHVISCSSIKFYQIRVEWTFSTWVLALHALFLAVLSVYIHLCRLECLICICFSQNFAHYLRTQTDNNDIREKKNTVYLHIIKYFKFVMIVINPFIVPPEIETAAAVFRCALHTDVHRH